MNRICAIVLAAACSAISPEASMAQDHSDVVGSWEMTMETPRGAVTQVFTFVLNDGALSGTASGRGGETDLQKIALEDGILTFEVVRNFRGNSMTQSFSASITGDDMAGTISGGRGGERDFKAKRNSG